MFCRSCGPHISMYYTLLVLSNTRGGIPLGTGWFARRMASAFGTSVIARSNNALMHPTFLNIFLRVILSASRLCEFLTSLILCSCTRYQFSRAWRGAEPAFVVACQRFSRACREVELHSSGRPTMISQRQQALNQLSRHSNHLNCINIKINIKYR